MAGRASFPRRALGVQIRRGCPARYADVDDAVIESLMARIACAGQIGIGLVERRAVFGFDRGVELPERLLRDGGDHVRKGEVVLGWMGLSKPIERAIEIAKFVRGKFPIAILSGAPEPLMPRLNGGDH